MVDPDQHLDSAGQILPKLRMDLGISEGTPITFFEENRRLLLQPLTLEYVMKLRGLLKGKPSPLETMMEERKQEKKS